MPNRCVLSVLPGVDRADHNFAGVDPHPHLERGAALGAVGAGMIDLNKARGTTANAVAPAFGTATGGMLAGFLVQYLPAPTHLVYAVLGVIFVLQGIGVTLMTDTIAPASGALASLRPQLNLPVAARGPLLRDDEAAPDDAGHRRDTAGWLRARRHRLRYALIYPAQEASLPS